MINIEQAVSEKFPNFAQKSALIRKPTLSFLKRLVHENQINDFLRENHQAEGFEFIQKVFDYFNFSYTVSAADRNNIPAQGRVVVIANHPIGSLDGLAILKLVGEVRRDVKIIANDMLMNFTGLQSLFIPLDNMTGGGARKSYRAALDCLENEEAIIVFPAGEVSRASPRGVRDTRWRPGFLQFARKAKAPLLPVHIGAKNSLLFYSASAIFKPLGTALLAREMFNKHSYIIRFRVGETIPYEALSTSNMHDRTLIKRVKKHLYKIGKRHRPIFETQKTIAHPENRQTLQQELKQTQLLGETRDHNGIYLSNYRPDSALMHEVGRLRELAFRKVGEGTGNPLDLDEYDKHYRHLILWDREALTVAGSYRLGEGAKILETYGEKGFYTRSLYTFKPEFHKYLHQAVELGRSFVNPDYWGKASLDYLWQGLGVYIANNPGVRYLIGPVSMSADYPRELMDMIVYFYRRFYACEETLATAHHPYILSNKKIAAFDKQFTDLDRDQGFDFMQACFQASGYKLPVLYKQYGALFEHGGFQSIVFSVDPDFGDCLDGLFMADLTRLRPNKYKRYIGS